ncbi:hypothetical protein DDI_0824 [Dickeya dianthicola RNS04.9]|nr:hypothetical protein DDI_0824 [Dickeya dianthicola RNS04.9]
MSDPEAQKSGVFKWGNGFHGLLSTTLFVIKCVQCTQVIVLLN